MRWKGRRQSDQVEDRRATGSRPFALGNGGSPLIRLALRAAPWLFRKLGPAGTLLALAGVGLWLYLTGGSGLPSIPGPTPQAQKAADESERVAFVRTILADTETVWQQRFARMNEAYRLPKVVLYRGVIQSACGTGNSAMGPSTARAT